MVFAPMRQRHGPTLYRELDLMFLVSDNLCHAGEQLWSRVHLVMEVVSPDDTGRDGQTKREVYATVGIPEYWVINPRSRRVTVMIRLQSQSGGSAVRADVNMAGRA